MERERAQDLLTAERERPEEILERHRADAAGETHDREDLLGRTARAEADLKARARAERRLAEGTYGVSADSGRPIPGERLERLPAAWLTAAEEARLGRDAPAPVGSEPDDEVRLPMPGEAYPGEGGAPDVGRPEPADPVVDRRYRPER